MLDVACGDGIPAFYLAEHVGPTGRVLAMDLSQAQLSRARLVQGSASHGWNSRVWISARFRPDY